MHVAAVWGRLECLKLLVTAGAICNSQTRHKETVRDLAIRYGNKPCVDFIDYSGACAYLYVHVHCTMYDIDVLYKIDYHI